MPSGASPEHRPGDSSVNYGQSSKATPSWDEAPREELAMQDSLESDIVANESLDEFMFIPSSMDMALPEKDGVVGEGWGGSEVEKRSQADREDNLLEEPEMESLFPALASLVVTTSANNEMSPVSSSSITYSISLQDSPPSSCGGGAEPPSNGAVPELLDLYTVNLHHIEKDKQRCDRNYWYFTPTNLEKLHNIMCSN